MKGLVYIHFGEISGHFEKLLPRELARKLTPTTHGDRTFFKSIMHITVRLRRTVICLFLGCGFLIVIPFSLTEPPRAFYKFGRGRHKERRRRRSRNFFRNVGPSQIIQTYVQLSWVKAKPSRRGIYLRSYLHARLAFKMGSLVKLEAPVGSITAHFFI